MKRLLLFIVWLPTTLITLFSVLSLQNYRYHYLLEQSLQTISGALHSPQTYQLFNSLPKILGATTVSIKSENSAPGIVKDYLVKHDSPMAPYADRLVSAAENNNLDPLLLLAIAQCESNLGKKMPENCYNPFGWGIHSKGTLCFNNWEEGFNTVARGLKEKYFDQGLESPEELMVRYTPPALEKGGSWAKCVNFFLENFGEE